MASYKGSRAGVAAEWKIRGSEYVRLIGHYPADIWQEALDEWTLGSKWFPDISEINDLMHPRLQERRRYAERLEAMLTVKIEHKPRACEGWLEGEAALRQEIGGQDFKAWISQITPHSDDGETLILAVPAELMAMMIREKFGSILERAMGREVQLVVTAYAGPAARARQAGQDSGMKI